MRRIGSKLKQYVCSPIHRVRYQRHVGEVKTFCLFVGYPRSAHTLVGQLLSAHPEILMTHEENILASFQTFSSPNKLLCWMWCRYFLTRPSFGKSYDYHVPNQYQGKVERLSVAGDKRGGASTSLLYEDFSLLEKFQQFIQLPLKLVHVVRNPFDNISSYMRLFNAGQDEAIDKFARELYPTTERVLQTYSEQVMTVYAEDFFRNPQAELQKLCEFLGVGATENYLDACAQIIWDVPHKSRFDISVDWTEKRIARVEKEITARFSFLRHYRFKE